MGKVAIAPAFLSWARETSGLSVEKVAKAIGVKPAQWEQWETADVARPTARQLEKLANTVKRPVAIFLRPTPPGDPPLPIDFRAAPDAPPLSFKTRTIVRRTRYLARVARELEAPSSSFPEVTADHGAEEAAITARATVAPIVEKLRAGDAWTAASAFAVRRAALESLNLLVFQVPLPRADKVSAFCLSDPLPVVVVNKRDHESRRSFSLFHEWGHLLLGEPGLCQVEEGVGANGDAEAFCNAFAAAMLVPLWEFEGSTFYQEFRAGDRSLAATVTTGVERFAVSRWVILRRLLTTHAIMPETYEQVTAQWSAEVQAQKAGGKNIPYKRTLSNLGMPFVTRVMRARESGAITDADASQYLGLKLKWFDKLEELIPV